MYVVLQGFYYEERVSISQGFVINAQISYKQHNRANPFNHAYLAKQELLDVI